MFNFIYTKQYNNKLKELPVINVHPNINDLLEIRKKLGIGMYSCKLLRQRSASVQEAINIHYKISMEINNL